MVIGSEGENETIFFLCFEDDACPFWIGESIELDTIDTIFNQCLNISLKSCYATQFSPAKIGMSDGENSLTEWYNSLCDTLNGRSILWRCDGSNRISPRFIEAVVHDFSCRSVLSDSFSCFFSFFPEIFREMSIVEISWIIASCGTFVDEFFVTDWYFVFCEFHNLRTNLGHFPSKCQVKNFSEIMMKITTIRSEMEVMFFVILSIILGRYL